MQGMCSINFSGCDDNDNNGNNDDDDDNDNDDTVYILNSRGGKGDYGSIQKRLFSQWSSQMKFQYLPSTSSDSSLQWIEHNPDCVQFSDPVPPTASEPLSLPTDTSWHHLWHQWHIWQWGKSTEGSREWAWRSVNPSAVLPCVLHWSRQKGLRHITFSSRIKPHRWHQLQLSDRWGEVTRR